ncbi:hypothetical protein JTE90_011205 [Oedothorax gibbosus]|uniref:Uncharacterized protein n=1 Tax=Oedothorax gibbosus TaxID=931172 RepID=A0AAV6W0I2_9ARAC|nr:hypothetical protein JTE90_011205 [Oedothorax gibbosus]
MLAHFEHNGTNHPTMGKPIPESNMRDCPKWLSKPPSVRSGVPKALHRHPDSLPERYKCWFGTPLRKSSY